VGERGGGREGGRKIRMGDDVELKKLEAEFLQEWKGTHICRRMGEDRQKFVQQVMRDKQSPEVIC